MQFPANSISREPVESGASVTREKEYTKESVPSPSAHAMPVSDIFSTYGVASDSA
ncbi:hypothetical protein MspRI1_15450 [Marinobacter sp. RI1]